MITLTLPYPPSANRYWRNVRGMMLVSEEARIYKREVGWLAKAAGAEITTERVSITLDFYRPRKAGDLDNRIKVCLDALNKVVWADDEQVIEIHARRFDDKHNPRVEVQVSELG